MQYFIRPDVVKIDVFPVCQKQVKMAAIYGPELIVWQFYKSCWLFIWGLMSKNESSKFSTHLS